MYFRSSLYFNYTWLYDDIVNGPILYNEQIELNADDAVFEANDKNWNVYFELNIDNPAIEAAEEFEYRYENAQWEMEHELEEKFGFGGIIAT